LLPAGPPSPASTASSRPTIAARPAANPASFGQLRYGFPTLDGETIKLAVHHEGELTTSDEIDRAVHASDLEPLRHFVAELLEGVDTRPVRSNVCMYTNTPDYHFLIGSLPGNSRITVLGGFSGHGFKFAAVIGDIAADLALQGRTDYPIELFSFERFAPRPPDDADRMSRVGGQATGLTKPERRSGVAWGSVLEERGG